MSMWNIAWMKYVGSMERETLDAVQMENVE